MALSRKGWGGLALAVAVLAAILLIFLNRGPSSRTDPRLAVVEQRVFIQTIRGQGRLQPVNRHPILPRVQGTILRLAKDGETVEQDCPILELDSTPYQEKLDGHLRRLRQLKAEWDRDEKKALKQIRQSQDVVESQKLRLELERLRLKELERGPTEADELNKRVALENARSLLDARQEELRILEELRASGFVAEAEVRQKRLEVEEQRVQVAQSDVEYRKLLRPDPVKLNEQRLKVQESERALASSEEKVKLLQSDLERARNRLADDRSEEEKEIKEHTKEIEATRILAPCPGIVLHGRGRWGQSLAPGREVHPGSEAMTVCDMRKMKAVVSIDEGRIGRVRAGQTARILLLGSTQRTCAAKVLKTAEKGRDEFEEFNAATRDLTGKANRQVFDVEVELEDTGQNLRPGQRVEVEIEVCRLPDALVVPRSAVFRDGADGAWVFVAADGSPERRTVEVLGEDPHACAVNGLKKGEQVWRVRP